MTALPTAFSRVVHEPAEQTVTRHPSARGPAAVLVRLLVRGYQLVISPVIGPHCRHIPTCSEYTLEAVGRFGAWRGGRLAVRRLLRCHPWGTSGYDPVPNEETGTPGERDRHDHH